MHVSELWRYPVKSMRGERVEVADIRKDGSSVTGSCTSTSRRAASRRRGSVRAARAGGDARRGRRAARRRRALVGAVRARAGARSDGAARRARAVRRGGRRPAIRRAAAHGAHGIDGARRRVRPSPLPAEPADRGCAGRCRARVGGLRVADRRRADRRPQPQVAVRHDDVRSRHARAGSDGAPPRGAVVQRSRRARLLGGASGRGARR